MLLIHIFFCLSKTFVFGLKRSEFYIELGQQIKKRFDLNDPVLNFISKFSPGNVLSGEIPSIAVDGLKLFPQLVSDVEKLNTEWRLADLTELKTYKDYSVVGF